MNNTETRVRNLVKKNVGTKGKITKLGQTSWDINVKLPSGDLIH